MLHAWCQGRALLWSTHVRYACCRHSPRANLLRCAQARVPRLVLHQTSVQQYVQVLQLTKLATRRQSGDCDTSTCAQNVRKQPSRPVPARRRPTSQPRVPRVPLTLTYLSAASAVALSAPRRRYPQAQVRSRKCTAVPRKAQTGGLGRYRQVQVWHSRVQSRLSAGTVEYGSDTGWSSARTGRVQSPKLIVYKVLEAQVRNIECRTQH